MKRVILIAFTVALICGLIFSACAAPTPAPTPTPAPAPVKAIKLKYGSWSPEKDATNRAARVFAEELEKVTGGAVTMSLTYGAALGKPAEYYDMAINRVADITHSCPAYTPGRFPVVEMMNYPIYFPDNMIAAKAQLELWKKGYFDKELSETKTLWLFTTGPYMLFCKTPISTLDELKGKKIRAPGGPEVAVIEALGGVPVRTEFGELYLALQTGTVDSALMAWSAGTTLKLYEVSKHALDIKQCAYAFQVSMNKKAWDELPKEAQKWIDESRERFSLLCSQGMQDDSNAAEKIFVDTGGKTYYLSPSDTTEMKRRFKIVLDNWVKGAEAKGVPARNALNELYNILQNLGVKEPYIK